MRLHVGVFGSEKGFGALDGYRFDFVHHFAPAVVTRSRIPFGVFVGQDGAHGFEHLVAYVVFRGYQFDAILLPVAFVLDKVED